VNQRDRDEVELGERVRSGLFDENGFMRRARALSIRMRVRDAQNKADIARTYHEGYGP